MPKVKTTEEKIPTIYSYSTPEIKRHDGWTKIGYTEQDVNTRIAQQTHTADVEYDLQWSGNAVFEGTNESFTDKPFHAYLRKLGIEDMPGKDNEWFHVDGPTGKNHFRDFRENKGILKTLNSVMPYTLRDEQEDAVSQAFDYFNEHKDGEFLWNAKPRFGKTLCTYDLCKRMKANSILIVTNRPAIANSWYDDYVKFMGDESGYKFVSSVPSLKGRPQVISKQEYLDGPLFEGYKLIEFVSLQDLKGSIDFGGQYDKHKDLTEIHWSLLVVDEAHEGVDTYKTDAAFYHINREHALHLSGTPFKMLANDKFPKEAIFNWTYVDEQERKEKHKDEIDSPYGILPKLNMFTYQMSEIVKDELDRGLEINGETEEYTFDLNEFFSTDGRGKFTYDKSVNKFIDALTKQEKFPFSTPELRNEIKHSLWILERVDSVKALARKLKSHPVFKDYEIIVAAGDGKLSEDDERKQAFDRVTKAIKEHDKTITLSVTQLTTGVTIPEWTAVLMLSNMKSHSLYMQATFRAQNPCLFRENGKYLRKENSYVFDFDPARTLITYEKIANDMYPETSGGKGDSEKRKENIRKLLNFFPVIGEDEEGKMIELDADKIMSIPRHIKSVEVVRRGFMSNFLFQNIQNIFGAPKAVLDVLDKMTPTKEGEIKKAVTDKTEEELPTDENGDIDLPDEYVVGTAAEVFTDKKIYDDSSVEEAIEETVDKGDEYSMLDNLASSVKEQIVGGIVDTVKEKYGDDMKVSDQKQIERELGRKSDDIIRHLTDDYKIQKRVIEREREEKLSSLENWSEDEAKVNAEYDEKQKQAAEILKYNLSESIQDFVDQAQQDAVKHVETKKKERQKDDIEEKIRDHLRGFSRTIPSFLMAYGDDTVTLATFDEKVPGNVFVEVTSITLDEFRFLRDGGKYTDSETGEEKEFKGNLFDPVVFDDSVKEFLRLKKKLADYFDEKAIEDIFDYIPPQKTNQIYTPKDVVKKMVDMLEHENPGCFDEPDKTFIDLYMKSGLYITEIVKRLYQSDRMKELYPDGKERLKHIFAEQVYGLAPTEIIYKIATNYILGFGDDINIEKHNFRQADALPYAKEGKLDELLEELYGYSSSEK